MDPAETAQVAAAPLPDYEKPPVIEVVHGVQFELPVRLTVPAYGVFWQLIRQEYPSSVEQPPLLPVFEPVGEEEAQKVGPPDFDGLPIPRLFFVDQTKNWVIQLQKDRFLLNWRKVGEDDVYPRFPAVSERFFAAWRTFLGFCQNEDLGNPRVTQLELTYINHIPSGEAWTGIADVGRLLPDLVWQPQHLFLPVPKTLGWKLSFVLPNRQGRLNTSVHYAVRRSDKRAMLLFELTARGVPREDDPELKKWFACAREWIVRGFSDLTSEQVQYELWRRRR